ncbi:DUF421 domain-containing protein [Streptomyces sp. NPDC090025]|uniref:DUF421 domain-containing protein n=1 Tax=Streptomyces sp. NPDC090025 TaxID=3365922 RepID=UPI00383839A2
MWHDMMTVGVPYAEKAARTILVYVALLILLRLVGKRGLAQLNTFDLVVMLLLSNVVQNAIIGDDNSVSGALFGAVVLMSLDWVLVRWAARFDWFYRLTEGSPTVLAKDGVYDERAARREGVRRGDVDTAVRTQGGDGIDETAMIVLEPSGALVVRLKPGDQVADKKDMVALRRQLSEIRAELRR